MTTRPLPLAELPCQRLARRGVEMIRWLVEDQEVGLRQQSAQQRHPHGFAAAESLCRRRGVKAAEAGLLECVLEACGKVPIVADQVEVGGVDAAGIDALQGVKDRLEAGERRDRFAGEAVDLLRQVEHGAGTNAAARGRQQLAGQQAREHALAGAVAANQAGVSGIELLREACEQRRAVGKIERCAVERQEWVRHTYLQGCRVLPAFAGRWENWPSSRRRHQWRIGRTLRR